MFRSHFPKPLFGYFTGYDKKTEKEDTAMADVLDSNTCDFRKSVFIIYSYYKTDYSIHTHNSQETKCQWMLAAKQRNICFYYQWTNGRDD